MQSHAPFNQILLQINKNLKSSKNFEKIKIKNANNSKKNQSSKRF